jgi:hypothetical protein
VARQARETVARQARSSGSDPIKDITLVWRTHTHTHTHTSEHRNKVCVCVCVSVKTQSVLFVHM